jgi:hypothetical protein
MKLCALDNLTEEGFKAVGGGREGRLLFTGVALFEIGELYFAVHF